MPYSIPLHRWACRLACKTIPALFLVVAAMGSGGCATCILWNTDLTLSKRPFGDFPPIQDLDTYKAHIPTARAVCVVDDTHLGIVTVAAKEMGKKNAVISVQIPQSTKRNGAWYSYFSDKSSTCWANSKISTTATDPTTWRITLGAWDPEKCDTRDPKCPYFPTLTDSSSPDDWSNLLAPGRSLNWIAIPEGAKEFDLPANGLGVKTLVIEYGEPRIPYNGPITYTSRILLTPPALALDIVTAPITIPGYLFLRWVFRNG